MYDRQVWEANAADTPVHRMDARTKLVLMGAVMILSITVDSAKLLFLFFLLTLTFHGVARSSVERWRLLMIFLLFLRK